MPSKVSGSLLVPSSKSQTIRALLVTLAARGVSRIFNPLDSADTKACVGALRTLGCRITPIEGGIEVDSGDLTASPDSELTIDAMNSGTTAYLLMGLLGTIPHKTITLHGDSQLNRRPVGPLAAAYNDLGMEVTAENGLPPVVIRGMLKGGKTSIECRTSQYLSSLLLSLPLAENDSVVDVPLLYEKPYVGMTLRWLDSQGIKYSITEDLQHVEIPGRQSYRPFEAAVSGDFSSATFFLAAAALTGSELTLRGLDPNDGQGDARVLEILSELGCGIRQSEEGITIHGNLPLKGGVFDINDMPDSLPALSVLGCVCSEPLSLSNVANARIKETDRIARMAELLGMLGIRTEEAPDGLTIYPGKPKGGIEVPGHGDHRLVMAMAVLSLITEGGLEIAGADAAAVTFPTFFELFEKAKENTRL